MISGFATYLKTITLCLVEGKIGGKKIGEEKLTLVWSLKKKI